MLFLHIAMALLWPPVCDMCDLKVRGARCVITMRPSEEVFSSSFRLTDYYNTPLNCNIKREY